jgi:hypothetical protein
MQRRQFLTRSSAILAAAHGWGTSVPATASIIPVVGDGKWIWAEPPENQTGYLEPRSFELSVEIALEGQGAARQLAASTPVPVSHPEQTIDQVRVESDGCQAQLHAVAETAAQLRLFAAGVSRGEVIQAVANFRLTICKDYRKLSAERFPREQPPIPRDVRNAYLADSPGIETRIRSVRIQAQQLAKQASHPWSLAESIHRWVWENIEPRVGDYTSVAKAMESRVGDCEERAAVFIALCRANGIPARLVWVPNHNWAEFYLQDAQQQGYWIPAHTAAYPWFGWTGAHELVLQKGDRLRVPEKKRAQRLLADWFQWQGARPRARFTALLRPSAGEGSDPGPGAREKLVDGKWKLAGDHQLNRYLRNT